MKKRLISLVALIMGTITFVGCSGKTIPMVKRSEILAESSVSSELPSFTKTENEDKNNVDLYKEESDNKLPKPRPRPFFLSPLPAVFCVATGFFKKELVLDIKFTLYRLLEISVDKWKNFELV